MLIPLVSILVVITLLPALLGGIGPANRLAEDSQGAEREPCVDVLGDAGSSAGGGPRRDCSNRPSRAVRHTVFQIKVGETGVNSLAKSGPAYATPTNSSWAAGCLQGVLSPIEMLTTDSAGRSRRGRPLRTSRGHDRGLAERVSGEPARACRTSSSSRRPRR